MDDNFKYQTERFADIAILRYLAPGFENLSLKEKKLLYYLYEAALSGRDITYDQNFKYNLKIRRINEAIVRYFSGDRKSDEFNRFMTYAKRVWFSNGIHHHYSTAKFFPECSAEYFRSLIEDIPEDYLPLEGFPDKIEMINWVIDTAYNSSVAPVRVYKKSDDDIIESSANNFYEGVTQIDVEEFYANVIITDAPRPVSYGLNSKLIKEDSGINEVVWKKGGMYDEAISRIIFWLKKAADTAENKKQKAVILKLIEYYETGDLKLFDDYSVLWVKDTDSKIDFINGFIETYGDPMSMRGTFESVVSFRDEEATARLERICSAAQWFEDNSPIMPQHKKKEVKGISGRAITVVAESGDASPATPIGINLPNASWIRKEYGSKSVNLSNIVHSYNKVASKEVIEEFAYTQEEKDLAEKYNEIAGDVHTDLHEIIGHGSGQPEPGTPTVREALKNFAATIEESRADLVALYFIMDEKLVELGILPSLDAAKAEYNAFIRNGLMTQLNRIKLGDDVEESHMQNRQLISLCAYALGKDAGVIEKVTENGKTYFTIRDHLKLRDIFGQMLREVQRITSQGDYNAAKILVESFGIKIDRALHEEVLARYEKLDVPPYKGFINPVLLPVYENENITDVLIEYPEDFAEQMMFYAENYSFLPDIN
ncbi:MAG: dihydrofolate reductase [Ignavibacteriaceae bacterium]|nr:dihydrofolate reductase [Ignavibacteriaceae bacterium]